ncbi:hypothetical protein [Effusibacillus dendaii]|uniref:Uncharacterized protein n=1 Tax=Effusibacillus dendaii TaxID=2743772 RepID=A0A7I8D9C9_9BACL|nr:hypothetical protein [Effusibacillus dendaii]BCJ86748.1 hypothetical protein skT53_17330 [Effusibacillus dendaii]
MTIRFNLDDVAAMLKIPVERVRLALEELDRQGNLTAETFPFAERAWRIAPIDIKRIQSLLLEKGMISEQADAAAAKPPRRIVRVVKKPAPSND